MPKPKKKVKKSLYADTDPDAPLQAAGKPKKKKAKPNDGYYNIGRNSYKKKKKKKK